MFSCALVLLSLFDAPARAEDRPVQFKTGATVYAESNGWFGNSFLVGCQLSAGDRFGYGGTATGQDNGMTIVRFDHLPTECSTVFKNAAFDKRQIFVADKDVRDLDGLTEAGLGVCDGECRRSAHTGGLKNIDPLSILGKPSGFVTGARPEKTDAELEAYVRCHGSTIVGDYERYKDLFKLAGSTFQVSYDAKTDSAQALTDGARYQNGPDGAFFLKVDAKALTCLAMRESRFEGGAVNKESRATGLFQQKDNNVADVNCRLNGCVKSVRKVVNGRSTIVKEQSSAKPWAKPLWDKYFAAAKRRPDYAALMVNPKTGRPCSTDMSDRLRDAACPINSTAAAGINFLGALLSFKRNSDLHKDSNTSEFGEDDRLLLTVLAASTNYAGSGSLADAIGDGGSPKEWLNNLSGTQKSAENRKHLTDYIRFMKNCLQHGNYKSVWDADPKTPEKDCRPKVTASAAD